MADSEHQSFTHVTAIEMAVAASTMVGTLHRFNCNSTVRTLYTGNGKMKGRWKDCQRSWKTIFLLIRLNMVLWFSAHFYVDRKHFEAGIVFCWMWVRYPLLGILSQSSGDAVLQLQSAHTAFSQVHCSLCWADEQYEESSLRCLQSVIQFPGCDVTSEREDKAVLRQPWERQRGSSDWGKVAGNKVQITWQAGARSFCLEN